MRQESPTPAILELAVLYITTNAALSNGEEIAMEMIVSGKQTTILGTVAYVDEGQGVGVRFKNLSPENEAL